MTTPTHRTLVARLVRHFERADDVTRSEGRAWYDKAAHVAEILAEQHGYQKAQTAYVIAALSPNIAWPQNVISAEKACQGHGAGKPHWAYGGAGYSANKAKASRILNGELEALSGPKVTQFAEGILGNPNACTVDLWMVRAVKLDESTAPKATFDAIRKAIRSAARKCGETPRDFQAIVWTQVRNEATRPGQQRLA